MAEIKVERTHEDDHRERRGFPKWLLAIPVLGLLLIPFMNRDDDRRDAATYQAPPAQALAYGGRDWAPVGAPVMLNDDTVIAAGRTSDGRTLYGMRAAGGGGGVGTPSRMYLRLADGRFQPLQAR